jgi:hypothetical protein
MWGGDVVEAHETEKSGWVKEREEIRNRQQPPYPS